MRALCVIPCRYPRSRASPDDGEYSTRIHIKTTQTHKVPTCCNVKRCPMTSSPNPSCSLNKTTSWPAPPAFHFFQTYGFRFYFNIKMIYNTFQNLKIITFRIKVYFLLLAIEHESNYNYRHTHTVITSKVYLVKWSTLRRFFVLVFLFFCLFFYSEHWLSGKAQKSLSQLTNKAVRLKIKEEFKKIPRSLHCARSFFIFYWSEKSECEMVAFHFIDFIGLYLTYY